ncbi:MAG: CPBP family intramembrane metalloprotease [Eubacteriales bacterium]|nr:CPBP family intramembrane metalloprotease [Eubacteriales bacterium]
MEIKKINTFFPVLIIGYIALSIAAGFVMGIYEASTGKSIPLWITYVLGELILLIISLIYMAIVKMNPVRDIPFKKIGLKNALQSILTGYLMIPMVLFLSNLSMLFSTNHLQESSQGLMSYPFLVQVILMAVIPPLVEETVFRGVFFGTYKRAGLLGGAVMSGLVFGCIHLNINQFVYAFTIGILFAVMVEATGSIWSSVLAHFAVNTYSIGMLKLLELTGLLDKIYEAQEISSSMEMSTETMVITTIVQMFSLAVMAFGFMALVFISIKSMAKRSGRLEYIRAALKYRNPKGNGVHFVTLPAALTFIMCAVYMIVIEII